MNQQEIEQSLRSVLAERSHHAPNGELLAEQIIAAAGSGTVRTLHTHRRRAWTLPLLTAAAVAAVVAGTVGVSQLHQSASGGHPSLKNPAATRGQSSAPFGAQLSTGANKLTPNVPAAVHLQAFRAYDLTFAGSSSWALGSATCLNGSGLRCTALLKSTSGGAKWSMVSTTPFNVPDGDCTTVCVSHLRFANDKVGYVYGQSTLKMTTDGGKNWTTQSGGADALETLDNNVIRVSSAPVGGCPPGCTFTVQTAPIGSSTWTTVPLTVPGIDNVGVSLSRYGKDAYLLFTAHTTGGAGSATSALFSSADDGATWAARGEICPQEATTQLASGEFDSTAVSAAADGSVVVVCTSRQQGPGQPSDVEVSVDGAKTFHTPSKKSLAVQPVGAIAGGSAQNICVTNGVVLCSQNGGKTFATAAGTVSADWLGFETPTVGHVLEVATPQGGTVSYLWTTTDSGKTWTHVTISL